MGWGKALFSPRHTHPMRIRVVRHGKPSYRYGSRNRRSDAAEFNESLDRYDRAGLEDEWNRARAPELSAAHIYVSDLPRAMETATLCTDLALDAMEVDAMFREVPLPRFREGRLRLPLFVWMAVARLTWYLGRVGHPPTESRAEARERVRRAADALESGAGEHEDVLLFAHGFFLFLLGKELRRRGWSTAKRGLYHYMEVAEFHKDA